jgi:hypothetical protein
MIERRWWHRRPHLVPRPPWHRRVRHAATRPGPWITLSLFMAMSAMVLSAWIIHDRDIRACQDKEQIRVENRHAIVAATDEVAIFAGLDPARADELHDRMEARMADQLPLPPPGC